VLGEALEDAAQNVFAVRTAVAIALLVAERGDVRRVGDDAVEGARLKRVVYVALHDYRIRDVVEPPIELRK
jgi:hypothetical protein